ncbi:MAG: dienelactone hydrolase family protein [Rhodospirillales bacterium]
MSGRDITIKAHDGGEFTGYLATPPSGSGPGLVVIQEIFGVNRVMRALTDQFAAQGFTALCPDLFWRQEPGIQITDQTEAEWARAFELFQGFDLDLGVKDVGSTVETLRSHETCSGSVGTVGYCLGGRLAYLAATRTRADASVGYYGVYLHEHLDEAIKSPLMLHIAREDEFVPKEAQDRVIAALKGNPKVTIHVYEGEGHAFVRTGGKHYSATAAKLADERTMAFLHAHLG